MTDPKNKKKNTLNLFAKDPPQNPMESPGAVATELRNMMKWDEAYEYSIHVSRRVRVVLATAALWLDEFEQKIQIEAAKLKKASKRKT